MLDPEVTEIRDLLRPGERCPIRTPPVQPTTHAAVSAFARPAPDEAHNLRRRPFGALWFDGLDIGDGAALSELDATRTAATTTASQPGPAGGSHAQGLDG